MEVKFRRSDKFASSLTKGKTEVASSQVIDVVVHQQRLQIVSDVTMKKLTNITTIRIINLAYIMFGLMLGRLTEMHCPRDAYRRYRCLNASE